MTRRHFIAIAEIIRQNVIDVDALPEGPVATAAMTTLRITTNQLMGYFKTENPLFDEDRFLVACGFNS